MANVLQSYMQGQQAVENNKRNRLLDLELQNAPKEQERRNRLSDLNEQRSRQIIDAQTAEQGKSEEAEGFKRSIAGLGYIIDSPTPRAEAERRYPAELAQLREQVPEIDSYSDDEFRAMAVELRNQVSAKAGIGPAPKQPQFTREDGPRGSVIQVDPITGERKQVVGPDNSQPVAPTRGRYRALSPAEVAAAGLPVGSSAQLDETTGKIEVLSKRDATSTLSQKDATIAKIKLNQIKVARQQNQAARERFRAIKGTLSAGPGGQGLLPSEAGRAFDKSVNTMRGSLTAITRVPGVGAMSDYETKLDQSKFPDRTDYESITEDQFDEIENLLTTIEGGYKDLLSGAQPQQTQQPAAPQGSPVRVNSKADALKLPPGTTFVTPDGRVMRRS